MVAIRKTKIQDRGKWAEGEVKKLFDQLKARHTGFDYTRLSDARVGRGAQKQVADFQVFTSPNHVAVEVKEVAHNFRMSKANLTQVPKMVRRSLAGGKTCIMVYSTTSGLWRVLPYVWVLARKSQPSYDMSELPNFIELTEAWKHFCKKNFVNY